MVKHSSTASRLVARAIREAGTTDTGAVMLKMEDILHEEMMARQSSFAKSTPNTRMYKIVVRLERMGVFTYKDVAELIDKVMEKRTKEAPGRKEHSA